MVSILIVFCVCNIDFQHWLFAVRWLTCILTCIHHTTSNTYELIHTAYSLAYSIQYILRNWFIHKSQFSLSYLIELIHTDLLLVQLQTHSTTDQYMHILHILLHTMHKILIQTNSTTDSITDLLHTQLQWEKLIQTQCIHIAVLVKAHLHTMHSTCRTQCTVQFLIQTHCCTYCCISQGSLIRVQQHIAQCTLLC